MIYKYLVYNYDIIFGTTMNNIVSYLKNYQNKSLKKAFNEIDAVIKAFGIE